MDKYVFDIINGLAGRWAWLDISGIFFAKYFEYILILCLAVLLALNFKKWREMVLSGIASALISRFVFVNLVRLMWFRPRPFVDGDVNQLLEHNPNESSFPSGHAGFYFALSTVLFLYNRKLGTAFYIFTILITLSRVFVGIHYPADILAGATIGILTGWLGYIISKRVLK